MPDTKQLLRETRDRIAAPTDVLDSLDRRRRHRENMRRAAAAVVAIVVALVGLGGWFVLDRDAARRPADPPEERFGIFAPLAGRIVYANQDEIGDFGYDAGVWAIDPNGPSDTLEGRSVADDVASTLVRSPFDGIPLGWSSDGTEALVVRTVDDPELADCGIFSCANLDLFIVHADGSETQVNREPTFDDAAISPDGERVAIAADGLFIVDAGGGEPVRIAEEGSSPTFSPDGTQIAYLVSDDEVPGDLDEERVWVVNVDGTDAHQILEDEPTVIRGVSGLQWSPADSLALGLGGQEGAEVKGIFTFAPDGSDFRLVITGGVSPYWSPDGSQIAYTVECEEQPTPYCPEGSILRSIFDGRPAGSAGGRVSLAIADADGSNVHEFYFAASGPWHPGASASDEPAPTPVETPTPVDSPAPVETDDVLAEGEVLAFNGDSDRGPGELVAVDPATGGSRVLLSDLAGLYRARWSADRRWVAYDNETGLWVVRPGQEPRPVSDRLPLWSWSPRGARLAILEGSDLSVLDVASESTTELGDVTGDVTSAPVWSPDGTRLVYGARGGTISSVDVESGERSLVVELPGESLDSVDAIAWSPDGAPVALFVDRGGLYLVNADGSDLRVLGDVDFGGMAWSPDDTRLAYVEYGGTGMQIFTQSHDGDAPILLGEVPLADCILCRSGDPVWSPDGARIGLIGGLGVADETIYFAVDADGNVVQIDRMTYANWNGGSYP